MMPPITKLAPSVEVAHTVALVPGTVVHNTIKLTQGAFASLAGKPVDMADEGHYMDDKGSFEDIWNDDG
ncbi:MAG: hypothetical protein ACLGIN_13960, partial [Candidatus Sericytochromatia bacterium]